MLLWGSIFVLIIANAFEQTWQYTSQDARCKDGVLETSCSEWEWPRTTDERTVTLNPGVTYEFQVDLRNLEGSTALGGDATLDEHRGVELYISNYFKNDGGSMSDVAVGGFFGGSGDDYHYTYTTSSKDYLVCDFGKNLETFTVTNQGSTTMEVDMHIDIDGRDAGCEFIDALTTWLTTVLILIGVCCGLGILGVLCCVCGGTALCCSACNQSSKGTVVATNQTQMVHQSQVNQPVGGSAIPAPAQPNYGGPPGATTTGTADLSMYSNGLAPGWEAKMDQSSGKPYWVNHNTQTSTWEDPRGAAGYAP